jgi:hypothetical protein
VRNVQSWSHSARIEGKDEQNARYLTACLPRKRRHHRFDDDQDRSLFRMTRRSLSGRQGLLVLQLVALLLGQAPNFTEDAANPAV